MKPETELLLELAKIIAPRVGSLHTHRKLILLMREIEKQNQKDRLPSVAIKREVISEPGAALRVEKITLNEKNAKLLRSKKKIVLPSPSKDK